MSDARLAIAETLGQELDLDLSPEFFSAVDKFLVNLWLHGFKIVPLEKTDDPDAGGGCAADGD